MKENQIQKEFRLAMNDLLSTDPEMKHNFESKNLYKDYPCSNCGAIDQKNGWNCIRHKATSIKEKYYPYINHENQPH